MRAQVAASFRLMREDTYNFALTLPAGVREVLRANVIELVLGTE